MEPLLLDKSLNKINVLFKFCGMNLHRKIKTTMDVIKYRFLYAINTALVMCTQSFMTYFVIVGISEGKELIELTSVAPCMAYGVVGTLKSLCHMFHEENVQKLIENLRKLQIEWKKREKCVHEEEMVKKETGCLHMIINALYFLNCLLVVVFNLTPLTLMAVNYYKTNELVLMLPYFDYFVLIPYDYKYWVFAYLHEVWSECTVHFQLGAADYLLFTCCTYIRVEFKLLQNDLEKMMNINVHDFKDYEKILGDLVKRHQNLISCSEMLETIYSKSMLINFLVSSMVICLTGFTVTVVHDAIDVFTYLTFLFMSLLQVFFLCFYADLLMDASTEVSDAVYNSQWYKGTTGLGKQILIVQTRAQKACKLTTAGFTDINLRSFTKVLSTSWSYFALLHTIYDKR